MSEKKLGNKPASTAEQPTDKAPKRDSTADAQKDQPAQQQPGQRAKRKIHTPFNQADYIYDLPASNKAQQAPKQAEKGKAERKSARSKDEKDSPRSSDLEDDSGTPRKQAQPAEKKGPRMIEDNERSLYKSKLQEEVSANKVFRERRVEITKTVENQLFGEYFKDRDVYVEKIQLYIELFRQLQRFPEICRKLQECNFKQDKIELLIKKMNNQTLQNVEAVYANKAQASAPAKPSQQHADEPQIQKKVKTTTVTVYDPLAVGTPASTASNKQQAQGSMQQPGLGSASQTPAQGSKPSHSLSQAVSTQPPATGSSKPGVALQKPS